MQYRNECSEGKRRKKCHYTSKLFPAACKLYLINHLLSCHRFSNLLKPNPISSFNLHCIRGVSTAVTSAGIGVGQVRKINILINCRCVAGGWNNTLLMREISMNLPSLKGEHSRQRSRRVETLSEAMHTFTHGEQRQNFIDHFTSSNVQFCLLCQVNALFITHTPPFLSPESLLHQIGIGTEKKSHQDDASFYCWLSLMAFFKWSIVNTTKAVRWGTPGKICFYQETTNVSIFGDYYSLIILSH